MEYTKIDDNTYEKYNKNTKMKVILSFSTEGNDKKINDFFIKTLSNLYLNRIFKANEQI